ncbi:SVM family protein, predicted signal peptide [Candidatus Phytoplasma rubi]|uniref:SVM family protein, predicted signal peptide n=1 Tax=Candidatus Phytoplasma rubi TaxID=399025 RepID=A0ABY7BRU7_9MOLU|nr:SVM family protein [Candidatus Phytoplasma rubi]WAN63383.1 SVM family protein, predicted signal peptide [Candidatus Phytoplasma rubi]
MFKIKNNLLLLLNAFFVFTFLGLFLITSNKQVMGMNKDIANTSNNNQNITNYSIEENIINLKYKIRENAVKKINKESEIQQLSNNDPIKNTLLALKQNLENLIHNQKEQLKTYQILLKTLNDENN